MVLFVHPIGLYHRSRFIIKKWFNNSIKDKFSVLKNDLEIK
jgi:hypothetical protein